MINLLPPSYKKEILQEKKWGLVLVLEFVFFVFLISLILILLSIKIYINGQEKALKVLVTGEGKTLENLEIQDFKKRASLTNQNLLNLRSFYKDDVNLVEILEKVFQALPPEVYLNSLSWQKRTSRVTLSGFAPNREDLLFLKKNLEEKKEFTEIDFPSSNWIKPIEIDFQTTFKISQ